MRPIFSVLVAPDAGSGPTLTDRSRAIFFFRGVQVTRISVIFIFFTSFLCLPSLRRETEATGTDQGREKNQRTEVGPSQSERQRGVRVSSFIRVIIIHTGSMWAADPRCAISILDSSDTPFSASLLATRFRLSILVLDFRFTIRDGARSV